MIQSELLAIACNVLKVREKSLEQGAIGFGFAAHWLKNWDQIFKPISKRSTTLWFSCLMLNQTYFYIYISKVRVSRKQQMSRADWLSKCLNLLVFGQLSGG